MEFILVLILAVVQGIAEFLPISSSGHLAVLGNLFGFNPDENMALGVVLHAGTLVAILFFYVRELLRFFKPERFHLALMVILGSIPAGVVGVALKKSGLAEEVFSNLLIVGIGFLFTGAMLQFSERRKRKMNDDVAIPIEKISVKQAILIGCAQAFAILPGVSRSGSTISAGLLANLKSAACAEFSFLLAIPAIGGAAMLELIDLLKAQGTEVTGAVPIWMLAAGFCVSAVVGYGALALLMKVLNRGKLAIFSGYLYCVGAAVVIWQLIVLFNK